MSKKHHGGPAPVPPGNQPHPGPPDDADPDQPTANDTNAGAPFQDQDVKRRLGDFGGAGEHPRQQPGRLNDGDVHSR
jgi:hypothetical protein